MMGGMADDNPRIHAVLTRDQTDPTPNALYSAWRMTDRIFDRRRAEQHAETIAGIDLEELSFEVKWIMRCNLILGGRYKEVLTQYPNLRPLATLERPDEPILLSDEPRHAWAWLRKQNIFL